MQRLQYNTRTHARKETKDYKKQNNKQKKREKSKTKSRGKEKNEASNVGRFLSDASQGTTQALVRELTRTYAFTARSRIATRASPGSGEAERAGLWPTGGQAPTLKALIFSLSVGEDWLVRAAPRRATPRHRAHTNVAN